MYPIDNSTQILPLLLYDYIYSKRNKYFIQLFVRKYTFYII